VIRPAVTREGLGVKVLKVVAFAVALVSFVVLLNGTGYASFPYTGLFGDTLGGLGGACRYLCSVYIPAPYTLIEMWVWFMPDPAKGMVSAEFKINYPSSTYVIPGVVVSNPMNYAEVGSLATGMSVTVGSTNCQYDWYWTHYQEILVNSMTPRTIVLAGNPSNGGHIYVESCEPGFPSYDATVLNHLMVNQPCNIFPAAQPIYNSMAKGLTSVGSVTPTSFTSLDVSFEYAGFHECTATPYEEHFLLHGETIPSDTIHVVQAVKKDFALYSLTLEKAMEDSTAYVLETRTICTCDNCSPSCGDSDYEFTFDASVGTMLQSSSVSLAGSGVEVVWELSEVDRGVEFFVSRSDNGCDFKLLDGAALERHGLNFTYADRSIEPGMKYSYKVEYGIGAPSKLLFMSETISTPAMPFTLYQNKPNPFNPSTTISFYLPEETSVRLAIYDISGRLVDRLIGGERRIAGTYNIEWNGRDSQGGSVSSGIYFYRLTAGKGTISKKMVLLR
jgi:hypothetical protein